MSNYSRQTIGESSQLLVEFIDIVQTEGEEDKPGFWCVTEQVTSDRDIVLHGFARRLDAEIALAFLSEFEVDYTLNSMEFWIQFGVKDRVQLMSLVCQRLQW